MADRSRNRSGVGRHPLCEVSARANTPPVSQRPARQPKPTPLCPLSPENKHVGNVVQQNPDPKRNSAVSTASAASAGRKRKTYIGNWQLGKTIGKGGCSRVRIVRHKTRDQYGAVKIITRSVAESTRAQSLANLIESSKISVFAPVPGYKPIPYGLEREIAVMKLLEHPNIVKLYDVWENCNEL